MLPDKLPTCIEFYECLCQRSRSRTLPRLDQKTTLNLMNCQGQNIKNFRHIEVEESSEKPRLQALLLFGIRSYYKYGQRQIREHRHQESWARQPSPCPTLFICILITLLGLLCYFLFQALSRCREPKQKCTKDLMK